MDWWHEIASINSSESVIAHLGGLLLEELHTRLPFPVQLLHVIAPPIVPIRQLAYFPPELLGRLENPGIEPIRFHEFVVIDTHVVLHPRVHTLEYALDVASKGVNIVHDGAPRVKKFAHRVVVAQIDGAIPFGLFKVSFFFREGARSASE